MTSASESEDLHTSDGKVDAVAALAVIAIVVATVVYWLGGM
ncbi:MAG: hypothetical protein ACI9GW_001590 [Halieaceae bacterium]|jgi:hypothetical protein